MMPLFPSPSLKFRTVGFPQSGFKAGISDAAFPVPWFAIALRALGCHRFTPALCQGRCAYKHLRASGSTALPQGPSLRPGLCCPGPSSLNRPHPPHSQARHNFIALRLICDAFAVRGRLGDPRVVPRFCRSILPSMSSSTSPGSRSLHISSSFATRSCLHRFASGLALPTLADVGAYWIAIATTC